MITTSADMFSLGALLSSTAAWVIGGHEEQMAYFQSRRSYHEAERPRFIGSGYEGCFHDSIEPLPVVKECHEKYQERCKGCNDGVTPQILTWIETLLMAKPRDRASASVLLERFD